jgi:hypothetical protein
MYVRDFFAFRKLISVPVVKVVYPIGVLLILFDGIFNVFIGITGVWVSLIFIVVGNLLWRLWCEIWIMLFGLFDAVKSLASAQTEIPPCISQPCSDPSGTEGNE